MIRLLLIFGIFLTTNLAQAQQDTSVIIRKFTKVKLVFKDENRTPKTGVLFSINDTMVYVSDMLKRNNYYDDVYSYRQYPIDKIKTIGIHGRNSKLIGTAIGIGAGGFLGTALGVISEFNKTTSTGANVVLGFLSGVSIGGIVGYSLGGRYRKKMDSSGVNYRRLNKASLVQNDIFFGDIRPVFRKRRSRVSLYLNTPYAISNSAYYGEGKELLSSFYGIKYMKPIGRNHFVSLGVAHNRLRGYTDFMGSVMLYSAPRKVQFMSEVGGIFYLYNNSLYAWVGASLKLGAGVQYNYSKFHTYVMPNVSSHNWGSEASVEIGAHYDLF